MAPRKKKYSDSAPPEGGVAAMHGGWSWIRERLDEKANEKTMLAIFEGVRGDIDDVKSMAQTGIDKAEKPHVCTQTQVLAVIQTDQKEIKDMLKFRGIVRIGAAVTVVCALAVAIAFLVNLDNAVSGVSKSMNETKAIVDNHSLVVSEMTKKNGNGKKELVKALADEMDRRAKEHAHQGH